MEPKVIYVFIFVASIILIMAILSNGAGPKQEDSLIKTVIIEGLESKDKVIKIPPPFEGSFCDPSINSSLEDIDKKCQTLSDKNCSLVNCCVFLNGKKCVGGTSSGPTYLSGKNGENVDVKYYRHKTRVYK